jgi:phage minor structural protein
LNFLLEVYDRNRKKIAILENAFNVGYTQEMNHLSTAVFTLMINDPKNAFCQPFNFIKLYEGKNGNAGGYVDMFIIMPMELTKDAQTSQITYTCEHVLGTLLNKAMFGYKEIGGVGTNTAAVLRDLLTGQSNWVLGQCSFNHKFQYSWENDNTLNAVFSVPNTFDEDYMFTWDTAVFPWKLNLVKPSATLKSYLRYGRNIKGIIKTEDASAICTRLYALGYGEGVNQLGIESVNPTGKPYIDAATINKYGLIEKIWTDLRYQIPDNLYSAAKAKLAILQNPKITYSIDAAEFYFLTGLSIDKFECGDLVRVIDGEIGLDVSVRVVRKSKANIENDHISCTIDISTGEIPYGLTDLYQRTRIAETYAQGATNITPYNFHQNADTAYPARLRFKIPAEAVYINKVDLSFQTSAFQAYSKAIKGGGARSDTTAGGGGATSGASNTKTTGYKGKQNETTRDGGASSPTTEDGGKITSMTTHKSEDVKTGTHMTPFMMGGTTGKAGADEHTHTFDWSGNIRIQDWVTSHEHKFSLDTKHSHKVIIADHFHRFDMPEHDHTMDHTHTLPSHTHSFTIPEHTHAIEYGIFQGRTARNFIIKVDGTTIPITTSCEDFSIIPYLKKNSSGGRIQRGWHELTFQPDDMVMLDVQLNVQTFINSRGGGNF